MASEGSVKLTKTKPQQKGAKEISYNEIDSVVKGY